MNEYISHIKTATMMAYSSSLTLITVDWLKVLDTHAAAFGVAIGMATLCINTYFQILRHRIEKQALFSGERRHKEQDRRK